MSKCRPAVNLTVKQCNGQTGNPAWVYTVCRVCITIGAWSWILVFPRDLAVIGWIKSGACREVERNCEKRRKLTTNKVHVVVYRVGRMMAVCKRHYAVCAFLPLLLWLSEGAEMNLKGSSYIKYSMFKTKHIIHGITETLSLRFKTINPSGLLFYAHGMDRKFIGLELFHCKLR